MKGFAKLTSKNLHEAFKVDLNIFSIKDSLFNKLVISRLVFNNSLNEFISNLSGGEC